jgi:hypothetical protein
MIVAEPMEPECFSGARATKNVVVPASGSWFLMQISYIYIIKV